MNNYIVELRHCWCSGVMQTRSKSLLCSHHAEPPLQACCQRDLQEQAHMARVKAQLLAHDRTDARRLVADDAVRRDFVSRPDGDTDSLASGSDDESAGALELYMHPLRACALNMECSLR